MRKKIVIAFAACLLGCPAGYAQSSLGELLKSIEANNLTLQAARENVTAKTLEARTGNSLDDLSVSYDHLWGSPAALGKTGELNISQSFDFPTVYAYRNRVAGNLAGQYENEYLDTRQQVLQEAKELYIELHYIRHMEYTLNFRFRSNEYLLGIYEKRYEQGDATLLEKTKLEHESLLLQESSADCYLRRIEIESRIKALNGGVPIEIMETEELAEQVRPFEQVLADYETYAPGLLAYKLQEEGAQHDVRLSRAQAIPKIELGYKHEYATLGDRFNGVTVGLSIPIFSNRHNVKRARAQQAVARLETQAALIECEALLSEMYEKTDRLGKSLERYKTLPEMKDYYAILAKSLNAGEITLIEYFSEVYSFYDVLEAKYRIEMEYQKAVARINMIYL